MSQIVIFIFNDFHRISLFRIIWNILRMFVEEVRSLCWGTFGIIIDVLLIAFEVLRLLTEFWWVFYSLVEIFLWTWWGQDICETFWITLKILFLRYFPTFFLNFVDYFVEFFRHYLLGHIWPLFWFLFLTPSLM